MLSRLFESKDGVNGEPISNPIGEGNADNMALRSSDSGSRFSDSPECLNQEEDLPTHNLEAIGGGK